VPSLRDLQQAFGHAIATGDVGAIGAEIVANGMEPAARLRIYRNNHRETGLACLRSTYPVVERLVGPDYFRQTAFEYLAAHPSRSGSLDDLGRHWPLFLERCFEGGQYAYLADVARLEWACQEASMARDHPSLDLEKLRRVPAERYAALIFLLHPAVRLVASPHPILRIWRANQPESDASERIDPDSPERVLLWRGEQRVELRLADAAEFEFVACVQRGESFADCVASAAAHGDFDPTQALQRLVAAQLIVDFV
jgi:hypothetical protein